jgi:hypothetical protein
MEQFFTTIAIDKYGRVYDISKEHPSREAHKKAKEKGIPEHQERCIVVNAFTCSIEGYEILKAKWQRQKKKK